MHHAQQWIRAYRGAIFGSGSVSIGAGNADRLTIDKNGNVGIGTTNPSTSLHVKSNYNQTNSLDDGIGLLKSLGGDYSIQLTSNNGIPHLDFANSSYEDYDMRLAVYYDNKLAILGGSVGIGTNNPSATLHVNSSADVGRGQNPAFLIGNRTGTHIAIDNNEIGAFNNNANSVLYINGSNSTSNTIINGDGTGNVGIGTNTPGIWRLAVNGNIRAKEIKVETGWSDFVFKKEYNLPTLKEVENHIKEKGHLKDIPSAKYVKENGIFLGKMDSKLLQKI